MLQLEREGLMKQGAKQQELNINKNRLLRQMENLQQILRSMEIYYDKKIKGRSKDAQQNVNNFHLETLNKCRSLMKAINLKNKKVFSESEEGYKLHKIKENLLEEGKELYDEDEEESDDDDEDEKFLPEHEKIISEWKGQLQKIVS